MTTIDAKTLLANFQRQMDDDAAALFLGAGMSRPAGFVNWKELMREIAEELNLDINKETDLIALAQWHKNRRKTRARLNELLVTEFTKEATLTENHRRIASLPISTIWTTNYDQVVERAFAEAKKRLDVKRRQDDLANTKPRCHATLYKMHGDVDLPGEAVLTKDDYAAFEHKRGLFSTQLRGHLVSKSFLFLGYSFLDPNMDYILARLRAALGENKREHYCVMRRIAKEGDLTDADVEYQTRQLTLRIEDLQNYGIQTVLIEEYGEITTLLGELARRAVRKNVFVSGSAHDFAPLGRERLEAFARNLGRNLIRHDLNLVSGLGLGIGGAVAVGSLEEVLASPALELDQRVIFRPFPQVAPASGTLAELWERYRQEMLGKVGFAIFLSGNRLDEGSGTVNEARGVIREFEIAAEHRVYPIPVGATGHAAAALAKRVLSEPERYFGSFAADVLPHSRRSMILLLAKGTGLQPLPLSSNSSRKSEQVNVVVGGSSHMPKVRHSPPTISTLPLSWRPPRN